MNFVAKRSFTMVFLVLAPILVAAFLFVDAIPPDFQRITIGHKADYFIDETGEMTLDEVISADGFVPNQNDYFHFGLSSNANWIRIQTAKYLTDEIMNIGQLQIYFNYAAVGDIQVFVPEKTGNSSYRLLEGGFKKGAGRSDEGFALPVFNLPSNMALHENMYIRVQSPYTANFQLTLATQDELADLRSQISLFLGVVSGIIISMILYNSILFVVLKDGTYLWYVLYMIFMLLYQSGIAGTGQIIDSGIGDVVAEYALVFSFIAIATHLMFSWKFLNVPEKAIQMKKIYYGYWGLCGLGVILNLTGFVIQSNIIAFTASFFVTFIAIATVVLCFRNGHWVSRYYLIAVGLLLLSLIFFTMRAIGAVEPSLASSYFVLVSAALEAILFSFALADRIKILREQHIQLELNEKKLHKMAITDALTGLFNRRHFDQIMEKATEIAQKNCEPISLMIIDIDHFKNINDEYGHQKGDEMLILLGEIIKRSIRHNDYGFRIGGEEFAVVLPHTGVEDAYGVAERIRHDFESEIVSVSIGVTEWQKKDTLAEFIGRADRLLYAAKELGRNQTASSITP
ncbi:MAG: GGDEF domain-containing protein [Tindallia sp. MSAO_Bac2]|nr:MAG: GGDEF domain-containing protein [Tindallia sp. MSAO_Bac2]